MTWMRAWTALMAGSCAAFISTLFYAAATGLTSFPPIERKTLYDVFLTALLIMVLICAVPNKQRLQWLAAIWVSVILLGALCLLSIFTNRDITTIAVTAIVAGALALLGYALKEAGSRQGTDC